MPDELRQMRNVQGIEHFREEVEGKSHEGSGGERTGCKFPRALNQVPRCLEMDHWAAVHISLIRGLTS
jgi:hypothetical protein